jgi:hypothetical protein
VRSVGEVVPPWADQPEGQEQPKVGLLGAADSGLAEGCRENLIGSRPSGAHILTRTAPVSSVKTFRPIGRTEPPKLRLRRPWTGCRNAGTHFCRTPSAAALDKSPVGTPTKVYRCTRPKRV